MGQESPEIAERSVNGGHSLSGQRVADQELLLVVFNDKESIMHLQFPEIKSKPG